MESFSDRSVEAVFSQCPEDVVDKLVFLREQIFVVANELGEKENLVETLKWGEPSYLLKQGSTIRISWLASRPGYYAMFFNCKSKLVETFRELFGDELHYDGNRAVVFHVADEIPVESVKQCIKLALTYHKIKHQWLLGA